MGRMTDHQTAASPFDEVQRLREQIEKQTKAWGEAQAINASMHAELERLREDIRAGFRIANELTLETQTVEEMAADLVRQVREARAARLAADPGAAGDAEFLSLRLSRLAKLLGYPMPNGSHEFIAGVAGTLLGRMASHIERQAAATAAQPDLHARIMNLPCTVPAHDGVPYDFTTAYKWGFRDARHAAAELAASPAAQPAPALVADGQYRVTVERNKDGVPHTHWEPMPAQPEPAAQWDDPRVQRVYELLCSDEAPPKEQHWEGWLARRIVDALAASPAAQPWTPVADGLPEPAACATVPTDAEVLAAIDAAKGELSKAGEALFGPATGATGASHG